MLVTIISLIVLFGALGGVIIALIEDDQRRHLS